MSTNCMSTNCWGYLNMSLCTTFWSSAGPLLELPGGFSPTPCPSREHLNRPISPDPALSAAVLPSLKPLTPGDAALLSTTLDWAPAEPALPAGDALHAGPAWLEPHRHAVNLLTRKQLILVQLNLCWWYLACQQWHDCHHGA